MSRKGFLITIMCVVLLVAAGAGCYYFYHYQKSQELLKNPKALAQQEQAELIAAVGQLIELPTDENPTVATVSDVSKLRGQIFFAHAKNGQKVLIYTKAKKAILYDPGIKKIVEVGPINLGQDVVASTPQSLLKVALYNGTTTVGLTTAIEKQLKGKISTITVVDKANASSSAYPKTLIIDLSGKQSQTAKELATILNGEVSKLPEGEKQPANADLLVILGK